MFPVVSTRASNALQSVSFLAMYIKFSFPRVYANKVYILHFKYSTLLVLPYPQICL